MKIVIAVAISWFSCMNATAGCYVYEFSELQSYSNVELNVMAMESEASNIRMLEFFGKNMDISHFAEFDNCKLQANRMRHIIDIRRAMPVKPTPSRP